MINHINAEEKICMINDNDAYVVYAKKGKLLRTDENPIVFIAGEENSYTFILRSAFISNNAKLNLLLMSNKDMRTPRFNLALTFRDARMKKILNKELLLCPHGSIIKSGQHFYADIDLPVNALPAANQLSVKINIPGSPIPFHVWTRDMKSIDTNSEKTDLRFKMIELVT